MANRVRTHGFAKVRLAVQRINRRLDQPAGYLGYAGAQGHRQIMKNFRDERGPNSKWEPIEHREGKPLQDTGRLRASIVWARIRRNVLRFWATVKYAAVHNNGSKKGPVQREFMWFPRSFGQKIARNFAKYVLKG